jgi:hypothetical protein
MTVFFAFDLLRFHPYSNLSDSSFPVKRPDPVNDIGLLILCQFGIDWQGKGFLRGLLRVWKVSPLVFKKGVTFLQVKGDGVVDVRADPFSCKELSKAVSFWSGDDILVEDMAILVLAFRKAKARDSREEVFK